MVESGFPEGAEKKQVNPQDCKELLPERGSMKQKYQNNKTVLVAPCKNLNNYTLTAHLRVQNATCNDEVMRGYKRLKQRRRFQPRKGKCPGFAVTDNTPQDAEKKVTERMKRSLALFISSGPWGLFICSLSNTRAIRL